MVPALLRCLLPAAMLMVMLAAPSYAADLERAAPPPKISSTCRSNDECTVGFKECPQGYDAYNPDCIAKADVNASCAVSQTNLPLGRPCTCVVEVGACTFTTTPQP